MGIRACALTMALCVVAAPALALENAPEKKGKTATISGTVVDGDGKPIGGATVSLFKDVTERPRHYKQVREGVETDKSGRFLFVEVPEGWYELMARQKGMAKAFRYVILEAGQDFDESLKMAPPVTGVVEVRDGEGKPLAGATLRELGVTSENGEFWLRRPQSWEAFDLEYPKSDAAGRLQLPPLPQGSAFEAIVHHPDWAPAKIKKGTAVVEQPIDVALKHGVELAITITPQKGASLPKKARLTLIHHLHDHASTIRRYPISIDDAGKVRLTVAPGRYKMLHLEHANYVFKSYFEGELNKTFLEFPEDEPVLPFQFHVLPKLTVSGTVVNDATGDPVAGVFVQGMTSNHELREELSAERRSFVPVWGYIYDGTGTDETDENGEYQIELPPGLARISLGRNSLQSQGYFSEKEWLEFNIPGTGTVKAPNIHVRPMPKVEGLVQNEVGEPVSGAVVRLRGKLRFMLPVLTDDEGRFELSPKWIPVDSETEERLPVQPLVAFHPYKRLMAQVEVNLADPQSLQQLALTLKPEPTGALLDGFCDELDEWERNELSKELIAKRTKGSLQGKIAPPLEGIWLNTPAGITGLEDFRGKFVLLDFWFIGCGPCHAEVPSLKLLHELYHDRGVVVIGVHNNREAAETVREYIQKEDYPYPVFVDHPDGRTISRYEGHGLRFYPSYILIGPDGRIIDDDKTIPGPRLRIYKIEMLREFVLVGEKRKVER